MSKEMPICPYCQSTAVRRDATATWDSTAGEWVLLTTYDDGWCSDCEEDIKNFNWVPALNDNSH